MKKIILVLTLAAFACSPLLDMQAQGAPGTHTISAKCKKHKAHHKKHKKHHKKKAS